MEVPKEFPFPVIKAALIRYNELYGTFNVAPKVRPCLRPAWRTGPPPLSKHASRLLHFLLHHLLLFVSLP